MTPDAFLDEGLLYLQARPGVLLTYSMNEAYALRDKLVALLRDEVATLTEDE